LGEKPLISDNTTRLDDNLLDELISHISTLASVYHKPPEAFVTKLKEGQKVSQFYATIVNFLLLGQKGQERKKEERCRKFIAA
jgi:hypothetical protein